MTIWYLQPPSVSAIKDSYHLQTRYSPVRISGSSNLRKLWLMHKPTVLGGEVQPAYARLTMPFGKMHAGIEEGNGAICGLL